MRGWGSCRNWNSLLAVAYLKVLHQRHTRTQAKLLSGRVTGWINRLQRLAHIRSTLSAGFAHLPARLH